MQIDILYNENVMAYHGLNSVCTLNHESVSKLLLNWTIKAISANEDHN